ncbi:hypothetical protein HDV05_006369 [Chytridiales sp. JEL 0842]|nr:hypothetical protein HDV05_006369 [Chytridiales sp. JEL 0842]
MKHGVKTYQKKLNRTPAHRKALLRNLATSLIIHGKIETTLPKAKFVRHVADKLIEWAKAETEASEKQISGILFDKDRVLPHLKLLAARFSERRGGYTRIIRNGHRSSATDRAPKAIVEYIDGPRDTMRLLAAKHLDKIRQDLIDLQSRKYAVDLQELQDPISGEKVVVESYTRKADIPYHELKQLHGRESFLQKTLHKLEKSVGDYERARKLERQFLEKLEEVKEQRHKEKLERLQGEYDAIVKEEEKGEFRKKLERVVVSDDPMLTFADAQAQGKVKYVSVDANGRLSWVTPFVEETNLEVQDAGQGENATTAQKETKEEGGTLTKLFKGLSLGSKK